MGEWIKVRKDLEGDPAVFQISDQLGIQPAHAVGLLLRLWIWADAHLANGNAPSVTLNHVDAEIVRHDGFAESAISAGWLVEKDGGICIPNFERHMGESSKRRELTNLRSKRYRDATHRTPSRKRHATSVTKTHPDEDEDEDVNPPLTPPQAVGDSVQPPKNSGSNDRKRTTRLERHEADKRRRVSDEPRRQAEADKRRQGFEAEALKTKAYEAWVEEWQRVGPSAGDPPPRPAHIDPLPPEKE